MKKFMIEISFTDKPQEMKLIEQTCNYQALSQVLSELDCKYVYNVSGIKIIHVGE